MNFMHTPRLTRRALAALGLATLLLLASGTGRAETIVVVRHADRDRSKPEQPLLPAGENRARELGRLLHNDPVDHIFFSRGEGEGPSEWLRMCQTAQGIYAGLGGNRAERGAERGAVAGANGTPRPEPIPRFTGDGAALRQWLLGEDGKQHPHAEASGHTYVLVLHHEDIPDLVDQLVSPADPKDGPHVKIGRDDYDNVFILTRVKGKKDNKKKFALFRLSFTPPPPTQPAATQPAGGCEAPAPPGGGKDDNLTR